MKRHDEECGIVVFQNDETRGYGVVKIREKKIDLLDL
jgi:hypothetical protein